MNELLCIVTKLERKYQVRRIGLALLLSAAIFAMAACGGGAEAPATAEATTVEATAAEVAATDTPQPEPTVAPAAAQPAAAEAAVSGAQVPADVAARADKYQSLPAFNLDPNKFYYATFKTGKGDIKVQLFAQQAPVTVNSFVFLAREGYYDNTTFHRVLEGFMAQGGDPTGTGMGGPGYEFEDEFSDSLTFDRPGLLAMANAGPGTNGSQFFITFVPTPQLTGRHTIFGEVIEGNDVLALITRRDPQQNPDFLGEPLLSVTIEETDTSALPTPLPPTPTPTPFAPNALDASTRPLADLKPEEKSKYFNTAPQQVVEAKIITSTVLTSQGVFTVELRGDIAPIAVNNFVLLADLGFYDNTPVNYVEAGTFFVIGAPGNNLDSDVGYQFVPETNLPVSGTVGLMAFVPVRQAADFIYASGSQILVTLSPPPDGVNLNYGFFGRVTEGADVLASLTLSDTIQSVTINK